MSGPKLASFSLVFGMIGMFFVPIIFGPVAIAAGIYARRQLLVEEVFYRRIAGAGIALGIVQLILMALFAVSAVVFFIFSIALGMLS